MGNIENEPYPNFQAPAFATSAIDGYNSYNQIGLTKLEYFSIHCLQGLLANEFTMGYKNTVETSIVFAKELLKQLENENKR